MSSIRRQRRGIAAVMMVVVMLIIDLVVVAIVLGTGRDHYLAVRRMETVEAIYAADAGMFMSLREFILDSDEDGDGKTGGISDDGNDANDPSMGNAQFVVTSTAGVPLPSQTTLTAEGRSGEARRNMTTVVE